MLAVWDYSTVPVPPSACSRVSRLYLSGSDPAIQEEHPAARRLVEVFARLGWKWSPELPRRESAVAAGLVQQRRNCLGYLPGGHSFISLFAWGVNASIAPARAVWDRGSLDAETEPLDAFCYPPTRKDICGQCRRCLDACPTRALTDSFVQQPCRCIDRNTWRLGGWTPRELRSLMGTWIYGCDVCQEVCPHNVAALRSALPGDPRTQPDFALDRLLAMSEEEYRAEWRRYFVFNPDRDDIRRNAAVAIGNLRDPAMEPALVRALSDRNPVVRGHAAWALGRIGAPGARRALDLAATQEEDPLVREEIALAMEAGSSSRPDETLR